MLSATGKTKTITQKCSVLLTLSYQLDILGDESVTFIVIDHFDEFYVNSFLPLYIND